MKLMLSTAIVAVFALTSQPQEDRRTFTGASENLTITQAQLIGVRDGNALIQIADAGTIEVPLRMLSKPDLEYIESKFAEVTRLQPLSEVFSDMLNELVGGDRAAGVVVKVAGDRIFTNLGARSNVMEGAELQIVRRTSPITDPRTGEKLGEDRDVAGRLRVISVQEKMSICELIDGQLEEKNSEGELCMIVSAGVSEIKVSIGEIALGAEEEILETQMRDALKAACRASSKLDVSADPASSAGARRYELRVSGTPVANEIDLMLSLVDSVSGRAIAKTTSTYKTRFSLAELGYKSALAVELGVVLKPDLVRTALQKTFESVRQAADALLIEEAGPRGEDAWVYLDGRVLVAATHDLSDDKQLSQMAIAFSHVASVVASVTAELTEEAVQQRLTDNSQVYTVKVNQYQSLYFGSIRSGISGWVINWPDAMPSWAVVTCPGSGDRGYDHRVSIDEKPLLSNTTRQPMDATLSHLNDGEHSLSIAGVWNFWFEIRAFFAEPNGRIAMYDKSNRPTATREIHSKALTSVSVPVPGL